MNVVQLDMFHSYVETKELIIELVFFNHFEVNVKLELFRSSYFGSKMGFFNLHAWELI